MRKTPSPSRPTGARRGGFTLIELLLVISIAGVLMATALPRMVPMRDGAGVRSARQVVQSYIATARQRAIRRGSPIEFHVAGNTIWVTSEGGATTIERKVDLLDAYSVTLTTPVSTVTYNGRGIASPRLDDSKKILLTRGASRDSLCLAVLGAIGKCGL